MIKVVKKENVLDVINTIEGLYKMKFLGFFGVEEPICIKTGKEKLVMSDILRFYTKEKYEQNKEKFCTVYLDFLIDITVGETKYYFI